MSATNMNFPVTDAFLLKYGTQIPAGNTLTLDPEYGNVELMTPFCRLSFVYFEPPKQGMRQQDGSTGKASRQCLMMFNPEGCTEIYQALLAVAENNFDDEQRPGPDGSYVSYSPSQLLYFPPGMNGLNNPLKSGTDTWRQSNKPQLYEAQKGLFTLNASMPVMNQQGNPQSPVYVDENLQPCSPSRFYAGCYARAIVRLNPYPRRGRPGYGKRGIQAILQLIQFAADGQRLGGFDALGHGQAMLTKAGAVPVDPSFVKSPQQFLQPGAAAPGNGAMPGFAAPPAGLPPQPSQAPVYAPQQPQYAPQAPVYAPQPQQQAVYAPPAGIPPQQPQMPAAYIPAGARPPGVA